MCVKGECETTMTTQISINVIKKYLKGRDHSFSWDLCVSVQKPKQPNLDLSTLHLLKDISQLGGKKY